MCKKQHPARRAQNFPDRMISKGANTMICKKCGKLLPETAAYCSGCGTPTERPEPAEPKLPASDPPAESVRTADADSAGTAPVGVPDKNKVDTPEHAAPSGEPSDIPSAASTNVTEDASAASDIPSAPATDAPSDAPAASDIPPAAPADASANAPAASDTPSVTAAPSDAPTDAPAASDTPSAPATSMDAPTDAPAASDTPSATATDAPSDASAASDTPSAAPTDAPAVVDTPTISDIVIREKKIAVSNGALLVDGTYYRKTKQRFKKKKGQISIPLAMVKNASVQRIPWIRKMLALLLLFLIFAAGAGVSGFFGMHTWELLHTPYRAEEKQNLEYDLKRLEEGAVQLPALNAQLEEASAQHDDLENRLELCLAERQEEITRSVLDDPDFDITALFSKDRFADAYRQYLCDLLDVFMNDEALHEWLYPYYSYSVELGENNYIASEMPFYTVSGEGGIFSEETASPETFLQNCYNYDLSEHIYYTGRIYITAAEFLNRVLHVPDYAVNGAVFLKAYGGTPDPAALNVPGWRKADYTAFWQDATDYLDAPEPFWTTYDLSAERFHLDWNSLMDEQAYYDAYLKFMDTIAPGLGVFDKVSYRAGDDCYGGMYYDITGREAAPTEIAVCYLEEHPEYLEEVVPDLADRPSSLDDQIETARKDLESLEAEIGKLTEERDETAALIARKETLNNEYARLEEDIRAQQEKLTHNLMIFGGIFLFLVLAARISLIAFIRLLKKPKRLMVLTLEDGTEAAFSLRFCSREKTAALLERLPTQRQDDPHT